MPGRCRERVCLRRRLFYMNIGYMLVFILDVVSGALSTLYLFVSLFVVLGQKIYRKVKYGKSLYD